MRAIAIIFLFISCALSAQVMRVSPSHSSSTASVSYQTYTDNFDSYADNSQLAGQSFWVSEIGDWQVNIPSTDGSVHPDIDNGESSVYYNKPFGDDQYSQAVVESIGVPYIGVTVRNSSDSYYGWDCNSSGSRAYIVVAGSRTNWDTGDSWLTNDIVKITVTGDVISYYRNGSLDTSIDTDGVITYEGADKLSSGYPGVGGWNDGSNSRLDSWEGGTN